VNVHDGIQKLFDGAAVSCGGTTAGADVVVAVVVPEKASEGSDRATLQLKQPDVDLIRKYSAEVGPQKLVVVMNAPGPVITSTWDKQVGALLVTWLPGQQNGRGIAMALYSEGYEASGRLPFTFPKCRSDACSQEDEHASVALGDSIGNKADRIYTDKALIGYRWYHAKGLEVSYPFGFGLFAYGSAVVLLGRPGQGVECR
jgi:beta-glucosidase